MCCISEPNCSAHHPVQLHHPSLWHVVPQAAGEMWRTTETPCCGPLPAMRWPGSHVSWWASARPSTTCWASLLSLSRHHRSHQRRCCRCGRLLPGNAVAGLLAPMDRQQDCLQECGPVIHASLHPALNMRPTTPCPLCADVQELLTAARRRGWRLNLRFLAEKQTLCWLVGLVLITRFFWALFTSEGGAFSYPEYEEEVQQTYGRQ